MPTFIGTDQNDTITPGFLSPGVMTDGAPAPSSAADLLIGGGGGDTLDGGGGGDTILAGSGDDLILSSITGGNAQIDGGLGFDTLSVNLPFGLGSLSTVNGHLQLNDFAGHADVTGVERVTLSAAGSSSGAFLIRDLTGTGVREVDIDLAPSGPNPDDIIITATNAVDTVTISTASAGTTPGDAVTTVSGLAATLKISGDAAGDLLTFSFGDDDDHVDASGDAMALLVDGGAGNDSLIGGSASDVLQGGDGDDLLSGAGGDDVLSAGPGSNVLIGGAGNDVFDLTDPSGRSVIEDFDPHGKTPHDQIALAGPNTTFTELVAAGEIFQQGNDVVITDGTATIVVLKNLLLSSLNDSDFLSV